MATPLERQMSCMRRGKASYYEGDFDKALYFLKLVVMTCHCNRRIVRGAKILGVSIADLPLPSCHCKDYLALPASTNQAVFDLAVASCSCGSGVKPCESQVHCDALSYVTGVYERRKDCRLALRHATMMVTLAPRRPDGYLKIAKVIRLFDSQATPSRHGLCNLLYIQASHHANKNGGKSLESGKALRATLRSIIRRDIVSSLPPELSINVLAHLSLADLSCRAMQVSKTWQRICCDPALWRHVKLVRNRRQKPRVRPGVLNDLLLKRAGQLATTLTIDGLWDFGFNDSQLGAMLKALRNLKTLNIAGYRGANEATVRAHDPSITEFRDIWKAICCHAPPTLTNVSLTGFCVAHYSRAARDLFAALQHEWLVGIDLAMSLERLSVVNMTPQDVELVLVGTLCRNQFPKLKNLSLIGVLDYDAFTSEIPEPYLALAQLQHCAPGLEDITLETGFRAYKSDKKPDFIHYLDPGPDVPQPMTPWAQLRRLAVCNEAHESVAYGSPQIPLSDGIRVLELQEDALYHSSLLSEYQDSDMCTSVPQSLEHVLFNFDWNRHDLTRRSYGQMLVTPAENPLRCFKPSIISGSLRSLDTVYQRQIQIGFDDIFAHRKGILEMLSCRCLDAESVWAGRGAGNWEDGIEWMATFPNLKVVGLYPCQPEEYHRKGWMMVTRFMELRPDVRVIYTNVLRGAVRDEVMARAAARGVTIVEEDRVPEPLLQYPPPPPWKEFDKEGFHEAAGGTN